jgi:hypothetical protein
MAPWGQDGCRLGAQQPQPEQLLPGLPLAHAREKAAACVGLAGLEELRIRVGCEYNPQIHWAHASREAASPSQAEIEQLSTTVCEQLATCKTCLCSALTGWPVLVGPVQV